MADEKIQLDITARDEASDKLDDVAATVAELEDAKPEVTVGADTSAAEAGLRDVADAAGRLSHDDTELVIRAQIDQAKGQLKELENQLEQTGDKAVDTTAKLDKVDGGGGTGLRGNAISDLTGPLGDASSAASDFGGVMDGLADTVEGVATKLGASSEQAGRLGEVVGGLGFVVAGAAAAWTLYKQHQEEAKRKTQEMIDKQRELIGLISDGNREAAATKFADMYQDAIDAGRTLGLTTRDIVEHITGQKDALVEVQKWIGNAYAGDTLNKVINATNTIEDQRAKWVETNGVLEDTTKKNGEIADALGILKPALKETGSAGTKMGNEVSDGADHAAEGMQRLNDKLDAKRAIEDFKTTMVEAQQTIQKEGSLTVDQMRGVEDSIVRAGQTAGLTPIEIEALVQEVDPTNVDKAFLDAQQRIDAKGPLTMQIHPELPPRLKIVTRGGTTILDEAISVVPGSATAGPAAQHVTINMPAGSRGVDVVRQVAGQARRSGRRFGVPVVTYARR
jgi:hypothetical protein